MGCGHSKATAGAPGESDADAKRTKEIDRALSKDREAMKNTVKLLLLGAGESGKSTLVKQMRLIYRDTYSPSERLSYREVVYANAVQSMQAVIRGYAILKISLEPEQLVPVAQRLLEIDSDGLTNDGPGRSLMKPDLVNAISELWQADATRKVVMHSNRLQLNDSAAYFFENIHRIGSVDYVPTDQDILHTRVRSTGIVEERFQMNNKMTLAVFDVGGQRSERKKWIHCFENVQVLVFVAAINEYDQFLWEDEAVSRMSETMMAS
ncbi:guanine nucleotide-binding protein subunit alpha [Microbotryomycetes sp. JL201]|nr:guanine nucleotide-binding protein subunit alpha [Microbotryomycetes sp. JL201]